MRITSTRPRVVTVTAAVSELSALAAGARMALALMRADPGAPAAATAHLERVLDDYDRGIRRVTGGDP